MFKIFNQIFYGVGGIFSGRLTIAIAKTKGIRPFFKILITQD